MKYEFATVFFAFSGESYISFSRNKEVRLKVQKVLEALEIVEGKGKDFHALKEFCKGVFLTEDGVATVCFSIETKEDVTYIVNLILNSILGPCTVFVIKGLYERDIYTRKSNGEVSCEKICAHWEQGGSVTTTPYENDIDEEINSNLWEDVSREEEFASELELVFDRDILELVEFLDERERVPMSEIDEYMALRGLELDVLMEEVNRYCEENFSGRLIRIRKGYLTLDENVYMRYLKESSKESF